MVDLDLFDKGTKYCVYLLQYAVVVTISCIFAPFREFLMHFKVWLLH